MVDQHQSVFFGHFLRVANAKRRKIPSLLQVVPWVQLVAPLFVNLVRLMYMATILMQTALIIQLRSRKAKEAAQATCPSESSVIGKFELGGVFFTFNLFNVMPRSHEWGSCFPAITSARTAPTNRQHQRRHRSTTCTVAVPCG